MSVELQNLKSNYEHLKSAAEAYTCDRVPGEMGSIMASTHPSGKFQAQMCNSELKKTFKEAQTAYFVAKNKAMKKWYIIGAVAALAGGAFYYFKNKE